MGGGTYEKGMELMFRTGRVVLLWRPIDNIEQIAFIVPALEENRNPFA